MASLQNEIAAYEAMRAELESAHLGKWVVIHDSKLHSVFDDFSEAASDAVRKFGRGPYLIRQVGAPTVSLPISLMYGPVNAAGQLRV